MSVNSPQNNHIVSNFQNFTNFSQRGNSNDLVNVVNFSFLTIAATLTALKNGAPELNDKQPGMQFGETIVDTRRHEPPANVPDFLRKGMLKHGETLEAVAGKNVYGLGRQRAAKGVTSIKQAGEYIDRLNELAPEGVSFNKDNLPEKQPIKTRDRTTGAIKEVFFPLLEGGACTSMAFDFLKQAESQWTLEFSHNFMNKLFGILGTGKNSSKESFINVPPRIVGEYRHHLSDPVSVKNRSIQAALNTWEVDTSKSDDIELAKMQALGRFFGYELKPATALHDLTNPEEKLSLTEALTKLEDGHYIVRQNQPNENFASAEKHGHTYSLIVHNGDKYIYDPNHGVMKAIDKEKLVRLFVETHEEFDAPQFRIYSANHS